MLADRYERVALAKIVVPEDRQRKSLDIGEDFLSSIRQRGVYNPIIITPQFELVAGERRLEASKKLELPDIPVRFSTDLSSVELQLIELEENIKRKELPWQDQMLAIKRIHQIYCKINTKWSQADTAKEIGISAQYVSNAITIVQEIENNNQHVINASGPLSAKNTIDRANARKIADAIGSISEFGAEIFKKDAEDGGEEPEPAKPRESLLNVDFLKWIEEYDGPTFNLIHCDFPYGVNVFGGKQANTTGSQGEYIDDPLVYWELLNSFCKNIDRVMSQSAHLVFWFGFDYYESTREFFRRNAPSLNVQNHPLYWVKSDNVGILPDPKRGPRRIVETAFIASREDRLIIKPVSNAYSAPTDKAFHPSTKPEPVLRNFFQMFVDENTKLLDPTCGSGSALRAAESLGAEYVLGLEKDPTHFESAQIALKKFRALNSASKKVYTL